MRKPRLRPGLALGLVLGLVLAPGAWAQTACTVQTQSYILGTFSDTAPAGSITPRNLRDFVCSTLPIQGGTLLGALTTPSLVVGSGSIGANSGTGFVLGVSGTPSVQTNGELQVLGHLELAPPGTPTLSSCGTGPSLNGNDSRGTVTEGASATGCTISWAASYSTAPICVVSSPNGATLTSYTPGVSSLILTNSSASGDQFSWICVR